MVMGKKGDQGILRPLGKSRENSQEIPSPDRFGELHRQPARQATSIKHASGCVTLNVCVGSALYHFMRKFLRMPRENGCEELIKLPFSSSP